MTTTMLLSRERIASRVHQLGEELTSELEGSVPVMVGVLNGAFPFLADLTRAMDCHLEVDFLALSRFGEGGKVTLAHDVAIDLSGRHVVIVEDIVDTGLTLRSLLALLGARGPASMTTVALLDKATRRVVDVPVQHSGFVIGDEFVVGYGMDWKDQHRNLPDLWAVLDLAAFAADPHVGLSRGSRD